MNDRVLELIELLQISESEFAKRIGISQSKISHIKNGRNNLSLDITTKILKEFSQVSPDWLILGNGGIFRNNKQNTNNQEDTAKKMPVQLDMFDVSVNKPINSTEYEKENELRKTLTKDDSNATQERNTPPLVNENLEKKAEIDSFSYNVKDGKDLVNNNDNKLQNSVTPPIKESTEINFGKLDLPTDKLNSIREEEKKETGINSFAQSHCLSECANNTMKESIRVKKIIVYYSDKTYTEFLPDED